MLSVAFSLWESRKKHRETSQNKTTCHYWPTDLLKTSIRTVEWGFWGSGAPAEAVTAWAEDEVSFGLFGGLEKRWVCLPWDVSKFGWKTQMATAPAEILSGSRTRSIGLGAMLVIFIMTEKRQDTGHNPFLTHHWSGKTTRRMQGEHEMFSSLNMSV